MARGRLAGLPSAGREAILIPVRAGRRFPGRIRAIVISRSETACTSSYESRIAPPPVNQSCNSPIGGPPPRDWREMRVFGAEKLVSAAEADPHVCTR
jgi:hypothetical protein